MFCGSNDAFSPIEFANYSDRVFQKGLRQLRSALWAELGDKAGLNQTRLGHLGEDGNNSFPHKHSYDRRRRKERCKADAERSALPWQMEAKCASWPVDSAG